MISTPVPGVMFKQWLGNRVLAVILFLKMLMVSFRKIDMVPYNIHINKKAIQKAVRGTSDTLTSRFETVHTHTGGR